MKHVWPRLPAGEASNMVNRLQAGEQLVPETSNPHQTFAGVGIRVRADDLLRARKEITGMARTFGMPQTPDRVEAAEFDKAVRRVLPRLIDISWSEASHREVWNWLACVLLPDVTRWRWEGGRSFNVERWIAHDLTRHTWARLWWQATTFEHELDLLDRFNESDLNQFFERREIGGRPQLVVALARSIDKDLTAGDIARRELVRDVTKRVRRILAYTDYAAMDTPQLTSLADSLVSASRQAITAAP